MRDGLPSGTPDENPPELPAKLRRPGLSVHVMEINEALLIGGLRQHELREISED